MVDTGTLRAVLVCMLLINVLIPLAPSSSMVPDEGRTPLATPLAPRATLPATGTYRGLATGDIDHDGDQDLVAAGDSGVEVWEGDGAGSWTARTAPTNTGRYYDVVLSDVNHDGDLDIMAVGDSGAKLWTGNGAWAWTAGTSPIGSGPLYSAAAADINIDGNPDLMAGGPGGIRLRLGNGAGGWSAGTDPASTGTYYDIAIGDLNLDGKLDIAAAGNDTAANNGTVKTFMGNGAGGWPSTATVVSGVKGPFYAVATSDIDRDGKPDLCGARAGGVHCWSGNGANVWTQAPAPTWAHDNRALLLQDLDNDGKADLVIGDENGTRAWLGDGGTSWPAIPAVPVHNVTAQGMVAADLDHDAEPDILVATAGKGLRMWLSDIIAVKVTGWTLASTNIVSTGKWADIDFGDVNNDGDLDLVVTSYQSQNKGIRAYLGDGTGTWTNSSTGLPVVSSISGARFVDLNHDGMLDLVATTDEMWTMGVIGTRVWKGNGDGTWTFQTTVDTRAGAGLEIGDFNNDGDTDLCTGYWTNAQGPMIFRGNGDLTFQADSGPSASAINVDDTTVGDVDNDGKQDFAASTMNNAGMQLWTGDGTGGAASWTREDNGISNTAVYLGLAMGDVDNDGDLDMAAAGYSSGNGVNVYLGDGGAGGTVDWTEGSKGLPLTAQMSGVELGDLDLDGDLDVLAGNVSNGGVDLFAGNGGVGGTVNWTEMGKASLPSTGNVWGVKFGDINKDGVMDIAATPDTNGIRVWRTDVSPVVHFDHVDISPVSANMNTSESKDFTAQAYDAANKPVAGVRYAWEIEGQAGIVSLNTTEGAKVRLTTLGPGTGKLRVTATEGLFAKGKTADVTVVAPPPPKDMKVVPQYSIAPGTIWAKGTNWTGKQENATVTIGLKALGRDVTSKDRLKVNFTLAAGIEPVNGTFQPSPNTTVRNVNGTTVLRWNVSSIQNSTTKNLKFDILSRNVGASVLVNVPAISDIKFLNLSGMQLLRPAQLTIGVQEVKRDVPGPPRNLTATAGDKFVQLSWKAPSFDGNSTVTGYSVYRGQVQGSEVLLKQVGNVTGLNDTNVTNDVKYFYKVTALNKIGEGLPSPTVNATPHPPARPPGVPQNLRATAGDRFVWLMWDPPLDDGGSALVAYRLFRGTTTGGVSVLLEVFGSSYNDTDVTNNVTYFYSISARNAYFEGQRTPEVNATPLPPTRLSIISGSTKATPDTIPAAGTNTTTISVNFWHNRDPAANSFKISFQVQGPGNNVITLVTSAKDGTNGVKVKRTSATEYLANLTWNPPDNTALGAYDLYSKVEDANGIFVESGFSANHGKLNLTKPWALPTAPQGLKAKSVSSKKVECTWNAPLSDGGFNLMGYKLYRSTTGKDGPYTLLGQPSTLSYTDNGVAPGKTYWYKVSAVTGAGEGPATAPVQVKVPIRSPGLFSQMVPMLLIVIVIVVVAVVVAILYMKKRRKGPAVAPPGQAPQQVDLIGGAGPPAAPSQTYELPAPPPAPPQMEIPGKPS